MAVRDGMDGTEAARIMYGNQGGDMLIEELEKPLDRSKVKQRDKGSAKLSYIESWHAIDEANRIFGFDGWCRETIYCKEISRVVCKIGKNEYVKDGWKVGYEAKVKIIAYSKGAEVVREGTGHGSGQMVDLFDCIESAAKEAESDAMKRALMTFGNPFGLALYDKQQRNVEDHKEPEYSVQADTENYLKEIKSKENKDTFIAFWNDTKNRRGKIKSLDVNLYNKINDAKDERLDSFNG